MNTINDSTCIFLTLIGIDEYSVLSGIKVFPNPAKDIVSFEFAEGVNDITTIEIVDVMGRIVSSLEIPMITADSRIKTDVSGLSSGIYNYFIRSGEKRKAGKLIIE